MDRFELQALRDKPIEAVAGRLGISVVRHKALCPFHDDHHASLSFSPRHNACRCFVCMDRGLGPIDLVMRLRGTGFLDACRWLTEADGRVWDDSQPSASPPASAKPEPVFDAARYERFFRRPWLSDEARRFLFTERRLDERVVRWCRLTSWTDRHGTPWLSIPYYDQQGRLIGVQNRNLAWKPAAPNGGESLPNGNGPSGGGGGTDLVSPASGGKPSKRETPSDESGKPSGGNTSSEWKPTSDESGKPSGSPKVRSPAEEGEVPRFRFPQGARCRVYGLQIVPRLREGDDLYITEGCSDCWAMLSSGRKAIAIPSATLLSPDDARLLTDLSNRLHLGWHMYPDRDVPGESLFLQLREILPTLEHHQLPPGCKDYSEKFLTER